MSRAFVYVVCGSREHIDTLNVSLKSFRNHSVSKTIVVTDSKRNEIPVIHDDIFDVDTPSQMDHHQASIYLKTSLHRILPKGVRYCYLDSDILALSNRVDDVFEEYISPIRFAPDHCNLPLFSPSALHCGCKEKYDQLISSINQYLDQIDPLRTSTDPQVNEKRETLKREMVMMFRNKPKLIWNGIRYLFSWPNFRFSPDFYLNKKKRIWYDSRDVPVMSFLQWPKIARKFGLRYNYLTLDIKFPDGGSIWVNQCNHLAQEIEKKFGVIVKNKEWQHWNGGVFLWDDSSHDFLDTWHQYTLQIFEDPAWKTRDQGTLIAAVWKWGLQNHPTLDKRWNYICDYNNPFLQFRPEGKMVSDDGRNFVEARLVHVYHHFGDQSWPFWRWVEQVTVAKDGIFKNYND